MNATMPKLSASHGPVPHQRSKPNPADAKIAGVTTISMPLARPSSLPARLRFVRFSSRAACDRMGPGVSDAWVSVPTRTPISDHFRTN